jgi:hypothetical protein
VKSKGGGGGHPVALWQLPWLRGSSKAPSVNALRYSPAAATAAEPRSSRSLTHLAVATQDGMLRVYEPSGAVTAAFRSYYGGLKCVDWSLDGRCLVAGGEDDTLTVWDVGQRRQLARCLGHSSFVAACAVLPPPPRREGGEEEEACGGGICRFASGGWDGGLCLWELALDALPSPAAVSRCGACIGSPCLRDCVHGASIGGGGGGGRHRAGQPRGHGAQQRGRALPPSAGEGAAPPSSVRCGRQQRLADHSLRCPRRAGLAAVRRPLRPFRRQL